MFICIALMFCLTNKKTDRKNRFAERIQTRTSHDGKHYVTKY